MARENLRSLRSMGGVRFPDLARLEPAAHHQLDANEDEHKSDPIPINHAGAAQIPTVCLTTRNNGSECGMRKKKTTWHPWACQGSPRLKEGSAYHNSVRCFNHPTLLLSVLLQKAEGVGQHVDNLSAIYVRSWQMLHNAKGLCKDMRFPIPNEVVLATTRSP